MDKLKGIKRILSTALVLVLVLTCFPSSAWTVRAEAEKSIAGKTFSILGASMSTFAGTSNGAAADTTNSTIRNNAKYYPNATVNDVTLEDTWWMQAANDLGLRLLVNNSWSGSSLLHTRNGTVGAYVDRCVQLHDDTGDNAGEEPDIIAIQMGTNDFQYYKDTLGTADIDYGALIRANGDGTYTYAEPVTSLEAAAIVLHKISVRYPDAEVYYLNISQRIDGTDELIRSFNGELKKVAEHFGAHIVDIYGSAITMESFPTYIGDGRVHPNKLGMDAYAEAFKRALLANTAYDVTAHTVSFDLEGVTADYGDDKLVLAGDSFAVNLSAGAGNQLEVSVRMGGQDITTAAYVDGRVAIDTVTADVTIAAKSVHASQNYRWEFDGTDLACVSGGNSLTKNAGTTTDGVFSKTRYSLQSDVVLLHDVPWVVEWKCEGTFQNSGSSSGARIFTSDAVNANNNARYVFKSNTNGLIAMGEKTASGSHNYGIALGDHDIDWAALHTYRLENRIANDGSNMIWLYVDGKEIGPMNHYYIGTTYQNTTSDWLSGKDFVFPYMGTDTHGFTNCSVDYIAVWENGQTSGSVASDYHGKVICVLSASTSTFAGYIPVADGFNLAHRARYPQDNLLTDVNDTWWMQLIHELDAKLGINDSWAGSQVLNTQDTNSGDLGPDAAMASLTRIQNLGANGTPDMILVFAGGNDMGRGVTVGSFDPATAPTQVDLTSYKWNSFADAYVTMIMRLQHYYPDSQIVVMTSYAMPNYVTAAKLDKYGPVVQAICDHYGVPYIQLRDCGVTFDMLPDKIHPNAEGMDYITRHVYDSLFEMVEMEPGENIVYSVTHQLSSVQASLSHYKGVSAGKSFTETLTGEDLTVSVTMGGVDITDDAYKDGKIAIPNVTGDIIITARAAFNADGHLQQLPENVCAGTNLWTALEPEKIYYTASGWGNTAAGNSWSVTFPVEPGERVWATAFGAYPGNGSTANGVRITWFDENGMLETLDRNTVYNEFKEKGYITVPEGATALNVPMTGNEPNYAVYLLDRDHDYKSVVTAPTCSEQGYTTYTCTCGHSYQDATVAATGKHRYEDGICTICSGKSWDTDGDGVLEVLAIGNSFSVDALQYAWQIANDLGIEEIVIGNLYISGCTLATHAANAAGDLAQYTYYYNDNGTWTTTKNYKISTALESRSWDYISMQQASNYSGVESTYNEDLTNLIAYVQAHSDAKLVWHMTWAYQQDSTHAAFPTYNSDQMTMYNAIVSAVGNKIVTNSDLDRIVPNGTAVQNSRTSLLGDTTTRDGYHMSRGYGCYLTGLMFIKTITGLSVDEITYAPSGIDAEEMAIAIESVNNAYAKPFDVTQSAYIAVEPELPEGFPEGYILLAPELYKGAFWDSTYAQGFNELHSDKSNSHQFYATPRFTKEELPIGSFIILEEGWQYRPEGWVTDALQTSREDTTAERIVEVTEKWWGDYTLRGFNISMAGLPSLTNVSEETVQAAFRIYVPEEKHVHSYASVVTTPTCTEQGYTTYTCECGHSYVDGYTDAIGHTYENGLCTACGTHLPGDINGDGAVNNRDAMLLFQYLSGWKVEIVKEALDVNGDGTVNNKDATRLFQYVSGWKVEIF